jgi:isoquinoline 1-oxidoreductase beta subunit
MLPTPLATTLSRPTRRNFLIGSAAVGAGLAVGFRQIGSAPLASAATVSQNPLAVYVIITPDNKVKVLSAHFDMGQGSYFGIATLLNEELNADWANIDVEGGWGNTPAYGNLAWGGVAQGTGGSTAMTSSWKRYRMAGAAARMMLMAAAAEVWGVPIAEIKAASGLLSHASGKQATYGEMAAKAATLPVPAEIPLKEKSAWTQIGNPSLKRFDSGRKSRGGQNYTIDVKLDGLKTAVMLHPPKFGATVASVDAVAAKAVKGVVDVVTIPRGVAVIADSMWPAIKARDLLKVTWDESKAESRSSADILKAYRDQAAKPGLATARADGDAAAAFAKADKVIEATYEFPYLAHAALEPLNAVARKENGVIEVWGGHQMPDLYQYVISQIAGTTPDKVRLHVMKSGGSFGRRAVSDADVISEAVSIGAVTGWKYPVKVQWTRDNDMRGGRYRPAYIHSVKAGLDKDGNLIAWQNHIVGQSILKGTVFETGLVKNGVDLTSVEGAANIPYAIPNVHVELSTMDAGVPVLWWRSVGSTHTAYVVESFIDELVVATGKDPIAYRLAMLDKQPRHVAALKLAAEKAGWASAPSAGRFRGVAVAESFNTVVAQIVEISMQKNKVKPQRVVCAVDCGVAVNPDQVKAQMQGGIGFGLGAILGEEITLTKGVVDQSNFDTFTPLRIDQMPEVEVHIVPSDNPPTGAGEPGVPPIGPALANAVYAATKQRIRALPLSKGLTT